MIRSNWSAWRTVVLIASLLLNIVILINFRKEVSDGLISIIDQSMTFQSTSYSASSYTNEHISRQFELVNETCLRNLATLKHIINEVNLKHGEMVVSALKHIAIAHRYSKGGKLTLELSKSFDVLNRLLHEILGASQSSLVVQQIHDEINSTISKSDISHGPGIDVCPEVWPGAQAGYPYQFDSHYTTNCLEAPPIASILTILINTFNNNTNLEELPTILAGIGRNYSGLPVIIACDSSSSKQCKKVVRPHENVSIVYFDHKNDKPPTDGAIWKGLLAEVKTKYVLIAPQITNFLSDARLERLVRLLNYTGASAVGGSFRNEDGHWSHGCFQSAMRNYAFRLVEGYDLSYNSCLYCDHIGGPFAARTEFIKDYLREDCSGEMVFVNAFQHMRWKKDTTSLMVCPDSMFFTRSLNISTISRDQWLPFSKYWQLNTVTVPTGESLQFTCAEANVDCSWQKGIAMPRCCLDELGGLLSTLMSECESAGMKCELEAGSALGAIKFNGNLPWERDGDIDWLATGIDSMEKLIPKFKKLGFSLSEHTSADKPLRACMHNTSDGVNCGYFVASSANWRIEIWGVTYLANHYLTDRNISQPTKVRYYGNWVNTLPNPAHQSRNLYGDDLFAHVEHWLTLGRGTGWAPYTTGKWLKCPRAGFHGCLDNFLPYGNLQFLELWV